MLLNIKYDKIKIFFLNALKTSAILLSATYINLLLLDRFTTLGNASEIYILSVLLI